MNTFLQLLNTGIAEVVEAARRAIVQVRNDGRSGGTGIVVDARGLVLTSAHVVRRRYPYVTLADGRQLRAEMLKRDTALDLAFLRVEADRLSALSLAEARPPVGSWVAAVGHPWGIVGAATTGIVTAADAGGARLPLQAHEVIVVDAHLRPGHSGGPLLDASGQVVGVNTLLMGPDFGVAVAAPVVAAFGNGLIRQRQTHASV